MPMAFIELWDSYLILLLNIINIYINNNYYNKYYNYIVKYN